ncbi:CYTH domain-containing protein [Natranaerovirga hydrolytica]|uniref:CYTH domain-containing protein n=1 Tax=Natranaerovirga hydrolytica TaxID=680378 RepID=A0A4R1MJL1_9FIRM|nr:CYTH domain-containing protein [Natranaerovirga hydrolytica]TCK90499.1 CYTH domain-containing protein [Natranaerovirga hydrolytica]
MEIERKYLVDIKGLNFNPYDFKSLEQGYICTDPVIRIRRENDNYILTYKSKGLLARNEINESITEETFLNLKDKIDYHMITKKRYLVPLDNGLMGELDIFEGALKGLILMEVEFDSVEASKAFVPPSWFIQEVTFDSKYQNNQLAKLNAFNTLSL